MARKKMRQARLGRLFQHAGTFCLVIEVDLGFRNGYMRIPDDHPWHDFMLGMTPGPGPDWDEISNVTGVPVPKGMRERSAEYGHRRSVAWYDWMSSMIGVHGGWTFADLLTADDFDKWVGPGSDGIPPGIWVGFDTGHFNDGHDVDLIRDMGGDRRMVEMFSQPHWREGHIWTIDDVADELSRCAEEMAAARLLQEVTVGEA